MDRWPGITYVEYSYASKGKAREVDWCFINKKILFDTDVAEAVVLIEGKTKQERVVLHSWRILFKRVK